MVSNDNHRLQHHHIPQGQPIDRYSEKLSLFYSYALLQLFCFGNLTRLLKPLSCNSYLRITLISMLHVLASSTEELLKCIIFIFIFMFALDSIRNEIKHKQSITRSIDRSIYQGSLVQLTLNVISSFTIRFCWVNDDQEVPEQPLHFLLISPISCEISRQKV